MLLRPLCFLLLLSGIAFAQDTRIAGDGDHDGLSDDVEQKLLDEFAPQFLTSPADCAIAPAAFAPGVDAPSFTERNGTVYGQAFPVTRAGVQEVELHYYHLWTADCGKRSHPLDAEHVSVLLRRAGNAEWEAEYWYAAAHEHTVCDVSRLYSARTLDAVSHGPKVWVSAGKHASFFSAEQCRNGCGADVCSNAVPLEKTAIVNLGEPGHPLNGASWVSSPGWELRAKMAQSDFAAVRIQRLNGTDNATAQGVSFPGMQRGIAVAAVPQAALGTGEQHTAPGLSVAQEHTERALATSGGKVKRSMKIALRAIGAGH
ncbi:MAG TPA: hypothetical protein VGC88_03200 [Terriglobales bacterium]